MATPYDPSTNPYIINPKELPSNQVAAAAVPAKNVGTANQWAQSPYFLPNWSLGGAPATSPVATASVTWPVFSIAPNTAVHAVATAVVIQGSGLTGATAVTVGGVACTGVTVVNDGEITATTGTTTVAGAANVAVTTPAGTGTLTGGMTFT